MNLQAQILSHVRADGPDLKTLRAKVLGDSSAIDAALNGLRRTGSIHLFGTRVMPGPVRPLPEVTAEACAADPDLQRNQPRLGRLQDRDPDAYRLQQRLAMRRYRERRRALLLLPLSPLKDPTAAIAHAEAALVAEGARLDGELAAIFSNHCQSVTLTESRLRAARAESRKTRKHLFRLARIARQRVAAMAAADTDQGVPA